MSRSFASASSQYLRVTSSPVPNGAFTVACWFKPTDNSADNSLISSGNAADNFSTINLWFRVGQALRLSVNAGGTAATSANVTGGVWSHACGVNVSATSRTVYLNGGNSGSSAVSVTHSALTYLNLGRNEYTGGGTYIGNYLNGLQAHPAIWTTNLTAAEVAALAAGANPLTIRPQSLAFYMPYLGRDTSDIDVVGNRILTVTGATASNDEPRIFYALPPRTIVSGSSSATPPPPPSPPTAPSGLVVTSLSSSQLRLDWTDNSANESGFKIESSSDGTSFTQIATVSAGVVTYTDAGLAASTTYYYRVRAYNAGGNSAYTSVASAATQPFVPSPEVLQFPRLGAYWIGGPQNYQLPAYQQGAAKFDLVIFNQWETWEQDRGGYTFAQACANVKALNPNIKIFQYQIAEAPVFVGGSSIVPVLNATITSQNWWVRTPWPSGPILTDTDYNLQNANVTTGCKNLLNGQRYHQWLMSTYLRDMYVLGTGTYSGAHAANPYLDGFFHDNVWTGPRKTADWNCDGVNESPDSAAVSESWRQDYREAIQAFRATFPNLKIAGNDYEYNYFNAPSYVPFPDPILQGVYDGGMQENVTGEPWSPEVYRTGSALLEGLAKNAAMHADSTFQIVNGWRLYTLSTTNFQDFRHFFALALCGSDGYVHYSDQRGWGSTNGSDGTARWFDEYDNAGTQRYYLGAAVDPRSTVAWTQGVFRRRFQNGWVLWNPRDNGTRTIALGQTMKKIAGRSGFSDLTVNNGATVTTVTIPARDGLVLLNP